jgi:hypothetical protein
MRARSAVTCLILSVGAACHSPTKPQALPATVQTTRIFSALPPVTVSAATGTLRITGGLEMNVPCYRFTATAVWQRGVLVITLEAAGTSEICTQDVARFSYVITVSGVPSGPCPLRVIHDRYGLPQYFETALEQTVLVP